ELEATISSNASGSARLVARRGNQVIEESQLALFPGEQSVRLSEVAGDPGAVTYRVEVSAEKDSVPQNDSGAALVLVSGPPKAVILEGAPDEGRSLAQALAARGLSVELRPVSGFPSGEELAATDAIVLVDVEASALTDAQVGSLSGFVRELGRGLVSIAGESSWSLGGYRNTALEDLLPLTSDIKDPRRRPSIAQVLAIDTSGSMATCHCADPNVPGGRVGPGGVLGGVNKTDISRAAAARAIAALSDDDEVGVLAFNTESKWVIPLEKLPPGEVIRQGLGRLHPTGGTAIPQALEKAVEELKASKASLKHIILFTDGWTNQAGLSKVAAWVKDQEITLSVLATGEGPGTELARMAEAGGGRFYPGRNLSEIPEIMMSEVMLASRRYVNEGSFFPKITGASAATSRLSSAPPLLGYVGTSAKASASTLLSIGEEDDPLLATWRTGLGVATAFTSDAKGRWAANWVSWDGFADFWSDVVRETLPAAPTPGFSLTAGPTEDGLEIVVESEAPLPEGVGGVARVVGPDGTSSSVELSRSGLSSLAGAAPGGAAGAYLVSVEVSFGGSSIYRDAVGAVMAYPAEYRPGGADETLMKEVAAAAGGRFGIAPKAAFDPDLPAGRRQIEIWPWLALFAALALPV
ncbi:MAG: VWA domain-containing protein, partial [Candidatus Methylomirabilales bacterium]